MKWGRGGPECQTEKWVRNAKRNLPAVHQHVDGMWYWFDETWAMEYGPFPSRGEADASCLRYAQDLGI